MEETQTSYLDQVEELTHKLSQAEMKVQTYENTRLEEGAKVNLTLTLSLPQVIIKGFCKQHRSRWDGL